MEDQQIKGITVCRGTVSGKARVISSFEEMFDIEEGDIVVIPDNNPIYAVGVLKASGVICEEGGIISHICTVALEAGIPTITQAKGAMDKISNNIEIQLNADKGTVQIIRN